VASGNSLTHTLKLVRAVDGVDVAGAQVTVNNSGVSSGHLLYGTLPSPVVLEANTTYYLVSQETSGGDLWYDSGTTVSALTGVTVPGAILYSGSSWTTAGSANNSYGPVGFKAAPVTWNVTKETRYVYDGMLAIQERDGSNIPQVSYTRGKDLSGGFQGAGGIGGLLGTTSGGISHFYHSDGGGNVTALLNVGNQLSAAYNYDPYGNLLSSSGPMADANPYRFSSKEFHGPSGSYAYGYRFYDPNFQRWLNRDPIAESGGINLFSFIGNHPTQSIDPFGWSDSNRPPEGFGGPLSNCPDGVPTALYANEKYEMSFNSPYTDFSLPLFIGTMRLINEAIVQGFLIDLAVASAGPEFGWEQAAIAAESEALIIDETIEAAAAEAQAAREAALKGPLRGPCFAAGTLVSTPIGPALIEDLQPGDLVLSYDFDTETVVERPIAELKRGETKCWLFVETKEGESLKVTRFHPFWVEDRQEWMAALDLEPGMKLHLSNGKLATVSSVKYLILPDFEPTFNFEVSEIHNYFVGQCGILVHNANLSTCPSPGEVFGGFKLANKSAYESAQALQLEGAKAGKKALQEAGLWGGEFRLDTKLNLPDLTLPGNMPHIHGFDSKGRPWSLNINGTLHDAETSTGTVSEKTKAALRSAGWGC
jgi:RHS repeat-associated protein